MHILHSLLRELKEEFTWSDKGEERGAWNSIAYSFTLFESFIRVLVYENFLIFM